MYATSATIIGVNKFLNRPEVAESIELANGNGLYIGILTDIRDEMAARALDTLIPAGLSNQAI